jgi:hypothetical protein
MKCYFHVSYCPATPALAVQPIFLPVHCVQPLLHAVQTLLLVVQPLLYTV